MRRICRLFRFFRRHYKILIIKVDFGEIVLGHQLSLSTEQIQPYKYTTKLVDLPLFFTVFYIILTKSAWHARFQKPVF